MKVRGKKKSERTEGKGRERKEEGKKQQVGNRKKYTQGGQRKAGKMSFLNTNFSQTKCGPELTLRKKNEQVPTQYAS